MRAGCGRGEEEAYCFITIRLHRSAAYRYAMSLKYACARLIVFYDKARIAHGRGSSVVRTSPLLIVSVSFERAVQCNRYSQVLT